MISRTARLLFLSLLALLCGCAGSVPPRQGLAMRDVDFPMREMRFPSGLRVLAEKDARTPLVGLFLVVGAGSSSDPPGKEGLAHYVEHLAFRSRPYGKSSFRRLLERAGAAQWNASTGLDSTVYYELGPSDTLVEMLRLEGARMLAPVNKVAPETLAVELDVVRNELRQRSETGFIGEVFGAMQAAVFPAGHPYARPVGGTHESLSAIQPGDVEAFLKQNYRPDNMTLLILGNVDLATIDALVQQSLPPELLAGTGNSNAGPRLPKVAPEPPAPPPTKLSARVGAVATPELWIGWSLPRSFDTDSYLIDFLERAAQEELRRAVREDPDIVSVTTSVVTGTQSSMLLCQAVLYSGADPERSLNKILNQLYHLSEPRSGVKGQRTAEIEFVGRKRSTIVSMMLGAESLLSRGVERATITHFSQDPTLYSRALHSVVGLERQQVYDYADRYLTRERARAILFMPPTGGSALPDSVGVAAPALDEDDPLPIQVDANRLRSIAPGPGVSAYKQITLSNGLQVILGARPGLPLAAVGLLFHGGVPTAPDPAAARIGLSLGFPRQKWHGLPGDFGAQWNSFSGDDNVAYMLRGAAGNVGIMLAVMAERVRSMDVDSGAWAPYKRDTVPLLYAAERRPEELGEYAFLAELFAGHPYGRRATARAIEDSSVSAAKAFFGATHVPRNAVLAVVGEIEPEAVEQMVREQFEDWTSDTPAQNAPAPPMLPAGPPLAPRILVTNRPGATQAQIHYGCILPPVSQAADDVRHDIGAQLVEDQLYKSLRARLGATYGMHAIAHIRRGGEADLSVTGAVENAKLGPALAILKETLHALADAQAPDKDFAWAKMHLAQEQAARYVTNADIVGDVLSCANDGVRRLDDIDAYAQQLAMAPAASVQEDFKRCLAGRPTLSIVGDEAAIRAALEAVGP